MIGDEKEVPQEPLKKPENSGGQDPFPKGPDNEQIKEYEVPPSDYTDIQLDE